MGWPAAEETACGPLTAEGGAAAGEGVTPFLGTIVVCCKMEWRTVPGGSSEYGLMSVDV